MRRAPAHLIVVLAVTALGSAACEPSPPAAPVAPAAPAAATGVPGRCPQMATRPPPTPQRADPQAPPHLDGAALRPLGRVADGDAGALRLAWPSSGAEVRFSGRAAQLLLEEEDARGNVFSVAVDGAPPNTLRTHGGRRLYPLEVAPNPGPHVAQVRRLTAADRGVTVVAGLGLVGGETLAPPAPPPRALWVVGEGLSAGYGVLGSGARCAAEPPSDDVGLAYGMRAAELLDAEATVVAMAGRGALRNAPGNGAAARLPQLFAQALPQQPAVAPRAAQVPPQALVVELGGSDFAAGAPPAAAFEAAYVAFVRGLRAQFPAAQILCVDGPDPADSAATDGRRRAAVAAAVAALGDPAVEHLSLSAPPGSATGCEGWPDATAHRAMGTQLAAALQARLGWAAPPAAPPPPDAQPLAEDETTAPGAGAEAGEGP